MARLKFEASTTLNVANMQRTIDVTRPNLARNSSFESWSAGGAADPDAWTSTLNGGTIAKATSAGTFRFGLSSVQLTQTSGGSGDSRVEHDLYDRVGAGWQGREVTAACYVKCSFGTSAKLRLDDGVGTSEAVHSGLGGWERLAVTLSADGAAAALKVVLELAKPGAGSVDAWFDAVTVVHGDSEGLYAPNPEERAADFVDFDNNGAAEKIFAPRMVTGTATFSLTGGAATETKTVTLPRGFRTVKSGVCTLKLASGTLDLYLVRISGLTATQITFMFSAADGSNLGAADAPIVDFMVFGVGHESNADQY